MADSAEAVKAALEPKLAALFGGPVSVGRAQLIGGGASLEAWSVDARGPQGPLQLVVRRSAGGRIYSDALPLENEYNLIAAAFEGGVKVPRPYGYIADLAGREAFVMERLAGETVGRRLVQRPELAAARAALPAQMAAELAKIHALPRLAFLPGADSPAPLRRTIDVLYQQLDSLHEPHPAIELGLHALKRELPAQGEAVVCHGDFRVGNLMTGPEGLVGVLDWEFAHVGDPREDLGWPLVRAWRFRADALRLGGIGQPDELLRRYCELTGRRISLDELLPFELLGNVRWALGALSQARRHLSGEEPSVELAVLGRLAAEMEHEILSLLGGAR